MATRLERVVVDLDDRFSRNMAGMAAQTALFRRELDKSSRDVDVFSRRTQTAEKSIDKFSGRLGLLANVAAVLGPALIPIGAVAVPAVAGLAAQFGFAAIAGGTAIAAFQGVGDALKAMNKAHLEPTAENLQAAKMAMQEISPEARKFVRQLREMAPEMKKIRDTAAAGMFPGMVEGLESMESLLPKVERIVGAVAGELGDIAADAGASLASERWSDFFDFLATDAPSALRDMATSAGNTGHAMAEMWMAFDPLNDDFSSWMVDATARLDDWATGLDQTQGFAEFVDYIRTTGPQVADTLGSIGNMFVQIVQAAAPIAGPILAGIEAFAKAVGAIADSDLGTPIFGMIAALSALNLAMKASAAISRTSFGGPVVTGMRAQGSALKGLRADWAAYSAVTRTAAGRAQSTATQMIASRTAADRLGTSLRTTGAQAGKAGALVGGLALVSSGAADGIGLTNTASLALMGTLGGPWGAAIGGAVGLTLDLAHANDDLRAATTAAKVSMSTGDIDAMTDAYAKLETKVREVNKGRAGPGTSGSLGDRFKSTFATLTGAAGNAQDQLAGSASAINGAAVASQLTLMGNGFRFTAEAAAAAGMGVRDFQNALAGLNGLLTKREALRGYTESLLDARAAIKESGETLTKSGEAFKGHARAGLESQRTLDRIAASAINVAKDMKPLEAQRYFKNARADFVSIAQGMGMSRAAARALAGQLLTLGGIKAKPTVEEIGAAQSKARVKALDGQIKALKGKLIKMDEKGAAAARARIAAMRRERDALRDKSITITSTFVTQRINRGYAGNSATGAQPSGDRGMLFHDGVRHFAYGDVANRHMPELAGPGPARVWREPETMGEAYIPLANDDRRPRARAIAEETVGLLGGEVEWFARGGGKGGGGGGNQAGLKAELARLRLAITGNTKAVDKQTAARDAIAAKRGELSGGVRDKFRTDLFGESNVWAPGGGAGGAMGILKADIAKANAFKSLLYQLSKKGLDGDALAELASTGDVGKAQAFASMSRKDLGTYESLYNQRARASSAVGAYAGTAAFSAQQAAATKVLTASLAVQKQQNVRLGQLEKALKRIGPDVARGTNRSAAAGKRGRK